MNISITNDEFSAISDAIDFIETVTGNITLRKTIKKQFWQITGGFGAVRLHTGKFVRTKVERSLLFGLLRPIINSVEVCPQKAGMILLTGLVALS